MDTGVGGAMLKRPATVFLSALLVVGTTSAGCNADAKSDAPPGETETGTDDTTTAAPASDTGATPDSGDDDTTTAASTDGGLVDSGGSSEDDTGGFIPRPDGGRPVPTGICIGLQDYGHLATIHGASEAPVDPTCDTTPDPCGGDPTGSWTIQAHCGLDGFPNFFEQQCPESTMSVLSSDVVGVRTFGEDGSFEFSTQLQVDLTLALDAMDCFGLECEAFGDLLDGQDNNLTGACSPGEGSECTCALAIANESEREGTFVVGVEGIVLTTDGIAADPVPACVQDDRLVMWEVLTESQAYPDTPCDAAADCQRALGDAAPDYVCVG